MQMDKHHDKLGCACSLETSAHSADIDSSIDVLLNTNMHFEVINLPFLKINIRRF